MEGPVQISCRHCSVQGVHITQCFSSVFPKPQRSRFIENWRLDYTDYSVKMLYFGCYNVWLNMSYKRIDFRMIHCSVFRISVNS